MAHAKLRLLVRLATELQASSIGLTYKEIQELFVDFGERKPSIRSLQRILGNLKEIDQAKEIGLKETVKWKSGYGDEPHLTKRFLMRGLPSALLSLNDEERVALERLLENTPQILERLALTKLLADAKELSTTRLKNKLDELIEKQHTQAL